MAAAGSACRSVRQIFLRYWLPSFVLRLHTDRLKLIIGGPHVGNGAAEAIDCWLPKAFGNLSIELLEEASMEARMEELRLAAI